MAPPADRAGPSSAHAVAARASPMATRSCGWIYISMHAQTGGSNATTTRTVGFHPQRPLPERAAAEDDPDHEDQPADETRAKGRPDGAAALATSGSWRGPRAAQLWPIDAVEGKVRAVSDVEHRTDATGQKRIDGGGERRDGARVVRRVHARQMAMGDRPRGVDVLEPRASPTAVPPARQTTPTKTPVATIQPSTHHGAASGLENHDRRSFNGGRVLGR